jgi:hypothetical protein
MYVFKMLVANSNYTTCFSLVYYHTSGVQLVVHSTAWYERYRMYHLRCNPRAITCIQVEISNQRQALPSLLDFPNLPCDIRVKVTLVARPLLTSVAQKLCRWKHGVFTSRTCVHSRELIEISHEAWRNSHTILSRLLPTLTQKNFAKSYQSQWKVWGISSRKMADISTNCCKAVL